MKQNHVFTKLPAEEKHFKKSDIIRNLIDLPNETLELEQQLSLHMRLQLKAFTAAPRKIKTSSHIHQGGNT